MNPLRNVYFLPSFLSSFGGESSKENFLEITRENIGSYYSSDIIIYNKNLAYAKVKEIDKAGLVSQIKGWFELHRVNKSKWLIDKTLNDFDP